MGTWKSFDEHEQQVTGLVTSLRKLLHRAQTLVPDRPGIHILAYHLIQAGTQFPVDVSLDIFKNQMRALQENSMLCSLDEAVNKLREAKTIRDHFAVVTFDDAYDNFYTSAWPVMEELQIPVTLYVPVEFVEGNGSVPISGSDFLPPCTWDHLRKLTESKLVSIGSHSCTHQNLISLDSQSARYEIVESRKKLEDKLSIPVTSFCYPRGLWSKRLEEIVMENYETAVVGGGLKISPRHWNPYRLYRLPIRRDMPDQIVDMLHNAVWLEERFASWVRPWRHRLQGNGHCG